MQHERPTKVIKQLAIILDQKKFLLQLKSKLKTSDLLILIKNYETEPHK